MLTRGLDASLYARRYWQAELEFAMCAMDGYRGDAEKRKAVGSRIRGLMLDNKGSSMGGLAQQFTAIEAQAAGASRQD